MHRIDVELPKFFDFVERIRKIRRRRPSPTPSRRVIPHRSPGSGSRSFSVPPDHSRAKNEESVFACCCCCCCCCAAAAAAATATAVPFHTPQAAGYRSERLSVTLLWSSKTPAPAPAPAARGRRWRHVPRAHSGPSQPVSRQCE